jgi:hypothetical protein
MSSLPHTTVDPKLYLPCVQNLVSQDVEFGDPSDFVPKVPKFKTKAVYKQWLTQPSSEHLLYCGYVGIIPTLRLHKEANTVHSIIALVADYDAQISERDLEDMLERAGDMSPNWVHKTPSGGARLVWLLDRPVLVPSPAVLMKTLKTAAKGLNLKGLLPGFDFENAFLNPTIYYDVGMEWMEIEGAAPLSAQTVEGWLLASCKSVKWHGDEIPLDEVEKRVNEQFPGRWSGPFTEGTRGPRFWDPLADNPTAAIIRPTGMQCFTGSAGFMPWSKIFGPAFVEQFTASRLSEIIEGVWYDGKSYWYQSADEKWEARAEKEMGRWLKVEQDLSADKEKNATFSEVEHALHMIDQHRRVIGAAPFVYLPAGMIEFMNKRVLNTARVKPVMPADGVDDWADGFPWIAGFFESFFDNDDQLLFFLAWLKRFYCGALEGIPKQGQALFIAGEPGQGKTLLSNRIISGLVGGHQDASQFLLGASAFNKELFHHGLWSVDDATPGDTAADHRKFSSLLKKVTANTTFEYHAKFQDSVMVEWTGRVIITGNLDAESLRILPDLDTSILDKIMLFRAATCDKAFPDRQILQTTITRELPSLAAWLVAFEIPEECISPQQRYGVKSYHHPDLQSAAGESTDAAVLDEIIQSFMANRVQNGDSKPWTGTATALMQDIFLDDTLRNIVGRNSARWFGIQLGKLEARARGVASSRSGGRKIYTIFPDKPQEPSSKP